MNRAKILEIGGYALFFFFCFFLFAYWTFPYDRVAAFIVDKVRSGQVGYTLEIGDLSPYWISGVELEDVRVHKTLALDPAAPDAMPAKDAGFVIHEARARLGLFALLIGNRSLSFDAELDSGEIDGSYYESGDEKTIKATLSGIDIAKLGLLDSVLSVPVKGVLAGEIDLTIGKDVSRSDGTANLRIAGLTIGDGKAKLKLGGAMGGGLTLDPLLAGKVTAELEVKKGLGVIKKLSNDGPDLQLEGSGDIRFAEPLVRSRLDTFLRLKITDSYRNKTSRTRAMFSLLDGADIPQVKAATTSDGAFQYRLTGTFAGLRAIPSGKRGPGTPTSRALRPAGLPGSADEE